MSLLSAENLYKTYGEKVLFDHISFVVSEQQRIGLIGVNGTGKSTLLKVIAGIESPDEGEILHANQFSIEYLPQNPEFTEELTVLEQIFKGGSPLMQVLRDYEQALADLEADPENAKKQEKFLAMQQKMDESDAWDANTLAKTILTKLNITDFSQSVKHLSGGQKKRVAIAKALIQPADLLILDEPTNHLDNETIEWLEEYLGQYPGALLLVTHDRYFLNRVTNRIFELDKGKLYTYDGNYELFLEKKAEREEKAISDERKRQNLLRRELAWLRRGAKARSTKQKARIGRVEKLQQQKSRVTEGQIDIAIGSSRLGNKVLEIEDVTAYYEGKPLIDHFSYIVTPGERLGIIGPNGSGKSTLLNILAGRTEPDSGSVEIGQTVKLGYYTQDNDNMNEDLRVIEYIKEAAEVIRTADGQVITAEQMLERFLFPREAQWTYIRKLSGGERRRLYLLRTLMGEPNVLFLDEPTNDLDTQTLTILEDYLDHFPGVVITVSHDRYFLDRVVDHLIAFEGNGVIRRFEGNYTEYLQVRNREKEKALKAERSKAKEEPQKSKDKKDRPKKLSYKDQQEWQQIEDRIAGLEEQLAALQKQIEEAGNDFDKVQELYQKQQDAEQELEQAMERWAELSLLVEEIENSRC
ncbi:ATP-binding cassette subfamily F protein uup [Scopulibacillus daqui]|uniref:ATP-binding cassette subfamily F protein uup n=1 Tax=Scopulibacillus daqui TaxID=1469162 RepID=A0ABS2PZK7_9BACL|nr:ABC-F family ATP-binding cassette domain-containing protein [Scopulibacillus daqui]MBM7645483.1 ATP-binding cassette subfamily F protein uup [Scopulibacillus daqui]